MTLLLFLFVCPSLALVLLFYGIATKRVLTIFIGVVGLFALFAAFPSFAFTFMMGNPYGDCNNKNRLKHMTYEECISYKKEREQKELPYHIGAVVGTLILGGVFILNLAQKPPKTEEDEDLNSGFFQE